MLMQTKKLGNTDLELTRIGLGTWAMGGPWQFGWGPQDDLDSIAAIHKALDLGINWIDTAPVYGLGHAETVVGKVIKGRQDKPIIATKCTRKWDDNGQLFSCMKRDSIKKEVEDSLGRLQIDVIDLYQIHWPNPDEDIEEGWQTVVELQEEGKVRHIGVSNFYKTELERIIKIHPVASLQPPYSMIVRAVEKDTLACCADNNIGVIPYSPMYKGLLTGGFSRERIENLAEGDHRLRDSHFLEPQ
jgi:aryl-alcohol dehydrogenase-like predicted oxidoreductase